MSDETKFGIIVVFVLLIVFTPIVFLINYSADKNAEKYRENKQFASFQKHLQVVELDGCEYYYACPLYLDSAVLTHKGNCKNLIHFQNNGESN